MSAIQRYLIATFARVWAVANSEVELPTINLVPFFRVASALFAAIAIGAAGFTAWHIVPGIQKADNPPALVAAKDHHPAPIHRSVVQSPLLAAAGDQHPDLHNPFEVQHAKKVAVRDHHPVERKAFVAKQTPEVVGGSVDFETQLIALVMGPEDEMGGPAGWEAVLAPDVDEQEWYDYAAAFRAEEDQVADLYQSPRPRMRPDIPHRGPRLPIIAGIPIAPEPPAGERQAQAQWLANAPVPQLRGNGPMIAVVIDDAGVAQKRTAQVIDLPAPLTIAFIPYGDNLERQTRDARARGHELLLHIPMEPDSADADPGYMALLTSLSQDEIMRRFRWALDRFDGYVGVNNHMGSKFMARSDLVKPVLEEINARGLLFLDSRTDHYTVGARLAQNMGMPHATRNVFLDNDLDAEKIRAQLAELERVARRTGHAIAIGHPHDVTIDVLADWIPDARRRGFVLVPVSTIVKKEYGPRLAAISAGGEPEGFLGRAQ